MVRTYMVEDWITVWDLDMGHTESLSSSSALQDFKMLLTGRPPVMREGLLCASDGRRVFTIDHIKRMRDLKISSSHARVVRARQGQKVSLEEPRWYQKLDFGLLLSGQNPRFMYVKSDGKVCYLNRKKEEKNLVSILTPDLLKEFKHREEQQRQQQQQRWQELQQEHQYKKQQPTAGVAVDGDDVAPPDWGKLAEQGQKMFDCYHKGCAFPEWSLDFLRQGKLAAFTSSTTCYFDARENEQEVRDLAREREPVNIEMMQRYDKNKLEQAFGYRDGKYIQSTKERLMPHIAIYCKTPLVQVGSQANSYVTAHIINAIGMGFDSQQQKDYQYFLAPQGRGLTEEKYQQLVTRMTWTWRYIFTCASDLGLKTIYNVAVGGGFFAELLNAHHTYKYQRLHNDSLPPVQAQFPDIEVRDLREIFDNVFRPENKEKLENSLLVNAWDPWSMVGNGNLHDNSLDGKMGRISAMAMLCWPPTNPEMKFTGVVAPDETA